MNPNRVVGGYKTRRARLLKAAKNASYAVKRDLMRQVAVYDRLLTTLEKLKTAA